MRRLVVFALLSCACGSSASSSPRAEDCVAEAEPPSTRREPIVEVLHGTEVADPYRWLERAGDDEVVAWMKAQDQHARSELEALPGRDALRARLRELMYFDAVSAPKRYGTRTIYARRHADREKAIYYVRERDGAERVLLDPNNMSDDGSISIQGVFPSPDGKLVAYRVSRNNADAATLHLLDLDADTERIGERIAGARYAVPSWLPDSSGFYYTGLPTDPMIPPPELPG
ncbi:MAG: S9 family peptidase, partial [Deltaproteobacteria bacterium]|nr:S9 family peptidase [Nannocystaceae bacterium]